MSAAEGRVWRPLNDLCCEDSRAQLMQAGACFRAMQHVASSLSPPFHPAQQRTCCTTSTSC